jgi:RNA polymerase sigma factor, sigma-70 family
MDGERKDLTARQRLLDHYHEIHEELSRLACCPHVGADLVQETFCRALRAVARGAEVRNTAAWLRAIGRNVARDHFRRTRMRASAELRAIEESGVDLNAEHDEESTQYGTDNATLLSAVSMLSPRARALIVGYYLEGKGCERLGIELGINRMNVKVCLHRARKRLRDLLTSQEAGR